MTKKPPPRVVAARPPSQPSQGAAAPPPGPGDDGPAAPPAQAAGSVTGAPGAPTQRSTAARGSAPATPAAPGVRAPSRAPVAVPRRSRHPRRLALVMLVALLVALWAGVLVRSQGGFHVASGFRDLSSPQPSPPGSRRPAPSPSPPPTADPTPSPAPDPTPGPTTGPTTGSDLRPPAALPATGSYVRTSIDADGDVEVTQWVRSRTPLRAVELAVPPVPPGSAPPVATRVRVDASPAAATGAAKVRSRERYELDVPVRVVRIVYTIKGGVERSPSAPGRALARVTALDVRYAGRTGPTAIDIVGPRVRNAACTTREDQAQPRPCGTPGRKGWQVTLTGAHRVDEVMAQVDLTARG